MSQIVPIANRVDLLGADSALVVAPGECKKHETVDSPPLPKGNSVTRHMVYRFPSMESEALKGVTVRGECLLRTLCEPGVCSVPGSTLWPAELATTVAAAPMPTGRAAARAFGVSLSTTAYGGTRYENAISEDGAQIVCRCTADEALASCRFAQTAGGDVPVQLDADAQCLQQSSC